MGTPSRVSPRLTSSTSEETNKMDTVRWRPGKFLPSAAAGWGGFLVIWCLLVSVVALIGGEAGSVSDKTLSSFYDEIMDQNFKDQKESDLTRQEKDALKRFAKLKRTRLRAAIAAGGLGTLSVALLLLNPFLKQKQFDATMPHLDRHPGVVVDIADLPEGAKFRRVRRGTEILSVISLLGAVGMSILAGRADAKLLEQKRRQRRIRKDLEEEVAKQVDSKGSLDLGDVTEFSNQEALSDSDA